MVDSTKPVTDSLLSLKVDDGILGKGIFGGGQTPSMEAGHLFGFGVLPEGDKSTRLHDQATSRSAMTENDLQNQLMSTDGK